MIGRKHLQHLWRAFMSQPSRSLWRVFALWAILVAPAVSGAADDDDPAEDAPAKVVVVEETSIDQWVFQENQVMGGFRRIPNAATGRARIESQWKVTLDELMRVCDLTEAQQRKLALASRGDIQRFFEQIEQVRKKFAAVKNDQNRFNEVWPEISSLQQRYSKGLFGEESLFAKTLRKTLTEEQQAKYQVVLLERRQVGYRAAIAVTLANLGNGIALRREQHESLLKLLMDETQPPLSFGQFDRQVVMLRLSTIPPEKMRAVLDKGQWKLLRPQLLQASGTEDYLAQYGVIEQPKANSEVVVRSVRTVVDGPATSPTDAAKPE